MGNRAIAVVAWLISLVMLGLLGLGGVLEFPPESGLRPDWHLVGLVPACLLGFFLCPYLDATFLLARARTDRQGARVAFTLGFGLVFFVMILFSLLYALPIEESVLERGTAWLLAIHLGVQVCFTCAAHVAVARGQTEVQALVSAPWLMGGVVLAAVLGIAALRADLAGLRLVGMSLGEVLYRSYMGFYGLLFPAYVLICMVGSGSPRLLVVTCLAALPPFVAAFLLGWMPWAAVGAGIILAAGLPTVLRRQKPVS